MSNPSENGRQEETYAGTQTISDIIRGMQYAVNTAQDTLQKQQFRMLEQYFDTETGEPEMRFITLPGGRRVYIPLITLIPANMLAIDELEMDFSVRIASTNVKSYTDKLRTAAGKTIEETSERSSFNVFFSGVSRSCERPRKKALFGRKKAGQDNEDDEECAPGDTSVIDIKIKFKSIEEPEASARIREMLYSQIQ